MKQGFLPRTLKRGLDIVSAELWNKLKAFFASMNGDDDDDMEILAPLPESPVSAPAPVVTAAPPMAPTRSPRLDRRASGNNIIGIHSALPQSEMLIVEPKSFTEATAIVSSLRERKAVIVNLGSLDSESSQRLVDFIAGATHAIDGHQQQIGQGIFLFSPSNVAINSLGEDQPWLNRDARDLFWRAV